MVVCVYGCDLLADIAHSGWSVLIGMEITLHLSVYVVENVFSYRPTTALMLSPNDLVRSTSNWSGSSCLNR